MKKLLFIFAAIGIGFNSQAQDILTKKSGEELLVKVLEITPELTKYKRFDNPDGPLISISNQDITQIKYQNGMVQKMAAVPVPEKTAILKPQAFRKHALALNVLPVLFQSVNVFYDRRFANNPNVTLSFGLGYWNQNMMVFSNFEKEITLTAASKFYIEGSDFYFSPYIKYRTVNNRNNYTWHQAGLGGAFGARHIFKSGFLIDSFLGLGGYPIAFTSHAQSEYYTGEPAPIDFRLGLALGYAF